MKRTIPIILALWSLAIMGHSQSPEQTAKDSLVAVKIRCMNDSLAIKIPSGQYKTQRTWYTEGSILSIVYDDWSIITILCGHLADLQLNEQKDNLFGRKTKVKGRTIIFENVKAERLDIFNHAFDLMEQN
jgi:hypothetical protein